MEPQAKIPKKSTPTVNIREKMCDISFVSKERIWSRDDKEPYRILRAKVNLSLLKIWKESPGGDGKKTNFSSIKNSSSFFKIFISRYVWKYYHR